VLVDDWLDLFLEVLFFNLSVVRSKSSQLVAVWKKSNAAAESGTIQIATVLIA
jgi:hypothetical protein